MALNFRALVLKVLLNGRMSQASVTGTPLAFWIFSGPAIGVQYDMAYGRKFCGSCGPSCLDGV